MLKASLFAVLLFALGVFLCHKVILGVALRAILRIGDWMGVTTGPVKLSGYVAFCLHMLAAFGLAFELPVLLVLLGYLGVVSSSQLRRKRAVVVVLVLIAAMLLTPPDVFTQLLMAGPLIVLYEVAIWIIRLRERAAPGD